VHLFALGFHTALIIASAARNDMLNVLINTVFGAWHLIAVNR
jgi:hypothetical protein